MPIKGVPLSSIPPEFNTSVPHKRANPFQAPKSLSSTPNTPQFHTKNPSVQHQKPLSSTLKNPQFHTKIPSVQHQKPLRQKIAVWNWGGFGVELRGFGVQLRDFGVELRGFWCWTEGFRVLKRCGPGVEPICWTEGVCVELRGTRSRNISSRTKLWFRLIDSIVN